MTPGGAPPDAIGQPEGGGAAITVSGGSVYVLRDNVLYHLRASDLAILVRKPLDSPRMAGGPADPNRPPAPVAADPAP